MVAFAAHSGRVCALLITIIQPSTPASPLFSYYTVEPSSRSQMVESIKPVDTPHSDTLLILGDGRHTIDKAVNYRLKWMMKNLCYFNICLIFKMKPASLLADDHGPL